MGDDEFHYLDDVPPEDDPAHGIENARRLTHAALVLAARSKASPPILDALLQAIRLFDKAASTDD